jgi:hypothetical protein
MTAKLSIESLISKSNSSYPSTGNWAYMTLLKGSLTTGLDYTVSSITNELTTTAAHGLVTGSRIRLVGGVIPTPLLANTDYYAIVVSATVLTLAATAVDAVAGFSIDLTDAGSGTSTISEQSLLPTDPLSVLVNKEISHPSWPTRMLVEDLGAAANVAGMAVKSKSLSLVNDGTTVMSFQYLLFVEGGTAALGSLAGTGFVLESLAGVQNIAAGAARTVLVKLRARNA